MLSNIADIGGIDNACAARRWWEKTPVKAGLDIGAIPHLAQFVISGIMIDILGGRDTGSLVWPEYGGRGETADYDRF